MLKTFHTRERKRINVDCKLCKFHTQAVNITYRLLCPNWRTTFDKDQIIETDNRRAQDNRNDYTNSILT